MSKLSFFICVIFFSLTVAIVTAESSQSSPKIEKFVPQTLKGYSETPAVTPADGNPMTPNISPTMAKDADPSQVQSQQVIFDPSSSSDTGLAIRLQNESQNSWYRNNITAFMISVKDGVVTLNGIANSEGTAEQAAGKIQQVEGVQQVINHIMAD